MLVRNSVIVFSALSFSTASAFLFQLLMGRSMSLDDFGHLSAFLSLQAIFSIPSGGLTMLYSRHAAALSATGNKGELSGLYGAAWRVCLLFALAAAVAVFAGLAVWGKLNGTWETGTALAVAILIAAYFVQAVPLAFVRGLQKFPLFAGGLGVSGLLKLLIAGFFVYAGVISVALAVWAIIAGVAVSIVLLHFLLRPSVTGGAVQTPVLGARQMFLFTMGAMAGTFFPMFSLNADMIMVRALYAPEVSGHYGAFQMVGKVLFLCGQVIGMALFPAVVAGDVLNPRNGNGLVWRAMALLLVAGGSILAIVAYFPGELVGVILKTSDDTLSPLLPYYGAGVLAVAGLYLEWNHRLARQQYGFLRLAAAGAVVQAAGIAWFSGSLEGMVKFQAVLFCSLLAVRLGILSREGRG